MGEASKTALATSTTKEIPKWYPWMVATGAMFAFSVRWWHYIYGFIATDIIKEFNVTAAIAGLMPSLNAVGLVIGGVILGSLAEVIGVRITITIAALSVGVFAILCGFSTSIWMAIAFYGLAGLLSWIAALFPKITRVWFPPSLYATANAYMYMLFRIVPIILGPFVGYIVVNYGWRQAFIIVGTICLIMAVLGFALIRDRPPGVVVEEGRRVSVFKLWGEALKYRDTWVLFAAFSAYTVYATTVVNFFVASLRTTHRLDPISAGFVYSAYSISGLIGLYVLLPLADLLVRKGISRKVTIAILCFIAAIASLVYGLTPPGQPYGYYIAIASVLGFFAVPLTTAIPVLLAERVPSGIAGVAGGFVGAVGQWTWIVIPPLWGLLVVPSYGWAATFTAAAPFLIVAGIFCLLASPVPIKRS